MNEENTTTITKNKIQPPSLYTVVIVNDDYTPMVFVVHILVSVFNIGLDDATRIMLKVHREGRAAVGSYTYEVAEHKCTLVIETAQKNEFPLQAFPEKI